MNIFKKIIDKIISFIYPQKCLICCEIISGKADICDKCLNSIKLNLKVSKLEYDTNKFVSCISLFKYVGKVRNFIHHFKFRGRKDISNYLVYKISEENIKSITKYDFDYITCVPLSKQRKRMRGYNQSECFARDLGKKIEIPYKDFLIKILDNPPQHELPAVKRIANVKGVYSVLKTSELKDKNILLCDDIVTTGNTLKECVRVLKKYGAKSVVCCTIAYV